MQMNTTATAKKASTVLGKKCEATIKNMNRLKEQAGIGADGKMEKITIPMFPGEKDDVVYVGLNGVSFYIKKGESVSVPSAVAQILRNTGNLI